MAKYYNFTATKDILLNIDRSYNYNLNIKLILVRKIWDEVVGDKLSQFTYPNNVYKGTLYVTCIHQGFMQALHLNKKMIYDKLQSHLKSVDSKLKIDDIRFVLGKKDNNYVKPVKSKEIENKNKHKEDIPNTREGLDLVLKRYFDMCNNS